MPSFSPLPAALLDPLPPIVQRCLRMALPGGIPDVTRVHPHPAGRDAPQRGLNALVPFHRYGTDGAQSPEFIWRARMHLGPLMTATVEDEYLDGIGSIDARLWGVIPLLHPEPHPRLDKGALLRYLAEAAWFPVALLPSARLHWQAAGNQRAVATLRDGTVEARLTVHFNSSGEIVHVEALRPYLSGDDYLSRAWSGFFSEWREFNGMRVPSRGRVFWHLDSGMWEYWRGTIDSLTCQEPLKIR